MPDSNMITFNDRATETARQKHTTSQTERERIVQRGVSRFPSVESVLDDIDAFLEAHGQVA